MSHPNHEMQQSKSGGSLMEDLINIFVKPSAVFEHQRNGNFFMPALIQSILCGVIVFALSNLISPFWDAESARQMARQAAAMAEKGQTMPEGGQAMAEKIGNFTKIAIPIIMPWFGAIFGGLFLFVGSRFASAKLTFGQSAMIATWSNFPVILTYVTTAIFGIVMDVGSIRGAGDGQIGLAKLFDPNTTSPALMTVFQNIDVFNIWTIIIAAIGVSVVGRVSSGSGYVAAGIRWLLFVLLTAGPAAIFQ
ncbi:MAG: YIP1 family protein [Gemmatimonas sp.]